MMAIVMVETGKSPIPNPKSQQVETPFGVVGYAPLPVNGREVIWLNRLAVHPPIQNPKSKIQNPVDPRAVAVAARLLGAERVIGVVRDAGVERPIVPADFIEFTNGRPTTFFETMGAGYVQQEPPFCPEVSQALQSAGAEAGGTLLVLDELPGAAERAWWQVRGLSLITTETQPEGALCRELELCYAVLAVPTDFKLLPFLNNVAPTLPSERHCLCKQATSGKWKAIIGDI